ncbi:MAG: response regulator transcription factor [Verrucomicrobiota bacterium]
MKAQTNNHASAPGRIRTLIADDSAAFQKAIRQFLECLPQIEVVGIAEDGVQAVTLVASTRPDLVLMDMQMPRLNGLHATRRIRTKFPSVQVIITTLHDSCELKAASLAAGAKRFIPKQCLGEELTIAIEQLFPGKEKVNGGI